MKKSVFVSYSWDSYEHQEWVKSLVDDLQTRRFKASMDTLETERNTVHIGRMMSSSIQNNDYTLVIMTPNYAYKADNGIGGVGTETNYIMNLMKENKNRVIPVIRIGEDNSSVPYYLKQINYVDFRDDNKYNSNFEKLLLRMQHKNLDELSIHQSGNEKDVQDINLKNRISSDKSISRQIPNLKKITELDKNQFIRETFVYLKNELGEALNGTKEANENFGFILDEVNSTKIILKIYVNGSLKTNYKFWIDSLMSNTDSIYISYGRFNISKDNSFNDVINVEENDSLLKLKRTMGIFGQRESLTKDELVDDIWEEIVKNLGI